MTVQLVEKEVQRDEPFGRQRLKSQESGIYIVTSERGGNYTTGLANALLVFYLVRFRHEKPQAFCVRVGMPMYIRQDYVCTELGQC